MNKGPVDRVAKDLLEIALLVSHKGDQAQTNGLVKDRPQVCQSLPATLLYKGILLQKVAGGRK